MKPNDIYQVQHYKVIFDCGNAEVAVTVYIEDVTKLTEHEIVDEAYDFFRSLTPTNENEQNENNEDDTHEKIEYDYEIKILELKQHDQNTIKDKRIAEELKSWMNPTIALNLLVLNTLDFKNAITNNDNNEVYIQNNQHNKDTLTLIGVNQKLQQEITQGIMIDITPVLNTLNTDWSNSIEFLKTRDNPRKINPQIVLELLNTLEFIDATTDEESLSVLVEDNAYNREVLALIGINCDTDTVIEDGEIDITFIAFDLGNAVWFDGDTFLNHTENEKRLRDNELGVSCKAEYNANKDTIMRHMPFGDSHLLTVHELVHAIRDVQMKVYDPKIACMNEKERHAYINFLTRLKQNINDREIPLL